MESFSGKTIRKEGKRSHRACEVLPTVYVDSLRESCHGSAALNTEHTEGGGAEKSPFFLKGIADDPKPSDTTAGETFC